MQNEVEKLLAEVNSVLSNNVNEEIAGEASVSTSWASQVRNGRKQSLPTQRAIAKVAIKKGKKLLQLGQQLDVALNASA